MRRQRWKPAHLVLDITHDNAPDPRSLQIPSESARLLIPHLIGPDPPVGTDHAAERVLEAHALDHLHEPLGLHMRRITQGVQHVGGGGVEVEGLAQ
jgi:hypothetical protein